MSDKDSHQEIDLGGQVAIVTGGGRGIGRAIAQGLASAGATVAVVARSADELAETVALIEQGGGRGIAVTADVTDQQAVEQMVREVDQQLGPVALLVNNAGHGGQVSPIWEVDPDEWWRCIDVNLRGPFLCSRAVLPGMIARGYGRIVTVASGNGLKATAYASGYVVSKTAAIRLCENLAAETKGHGISVFAMAPGYVRTALNEALAQSEGMRKWYPKHYEMLSKGGWGGPPEPTADLVVLLASGQADALSGCYVSVEDDDVTEMISRAEEIHEGELHRLRLRT